MPASNRWSPHLLFIISLPLLLFWRWLFKGEVLFWGTLLFQFWPWHQLVKTSLLAGQWPLWDPLLGNGAPLLANLQSAVFYPPNLLYLLLPVEHGLTLSVILHLMLAGVSMYFYGRQIGLLPFGATLSALTYMFSGYLVGRTQFVTMIDAAAWLPLLLLLAEKLATRRARLDILWLGLALAMQFLAGHAQLWFYSLCLIGAYTLFRSWQERQPETPTALTVTQIGIEQTHAPPDPDEPTTYGKRQIKNQKSKIKNLQHATGRLALAVGLALLLAAAQLLPTAELVTQSPRGSGAEVTFALTYSFWPWRLITLLAPNFFGHPAQDNYWGYANYWEDHAYLGVLPFLLALTTIWRWGRSIFRCPHDQPSPDSPDRMVPFFAALIPISLILAMGWNTPLYLWVFETLPGFAYFQAPARLLIWYSVAMAILAGLGAQSFELTPSRRAGWQRLLVAALGLIMAGLAGDLALSGRSRTFGMAILALGIWLTLSIILLLAGPTSATAGLRRTGRWQWLVIIFVAGDLLVAAGPLNPTLSAAVFNQPLASASFLQGQPAGYRFYVEDRFDYDLKFKQYFRFDTFGPLAVDHWQGLRESLAPNLGIYAGLPAANNDDPLVIGRWQRLTGLLKNAVEPQRGRLLRLMNVGYVIGEAGTASGSIIYAHEGVMIRQVAEPLPRAYFISQVYQAQNEAEATARLSAPDFEPRREAVIMKGESEPAAQTPVDLAEPPGRSKPAAPAEFQPVLVSEQGPGRVLLSVEAPTSGFVVLTDTFYPGWQATLDGQPAPIWPANLAFRAVAVKAGSHEIIFSYRPRSFSLGLLISVVTLVMVTVGIFYSY